MTEQKRQTEASIIKAGESDLQTIQDMAEVVFRDTYREILSEEQIEYMMDWMYSLPNLRKQLAEGHVYYMACSDGRPCGYMSIQSEGSDEDNTAVYHLHKIYVMPLEQGRGIGRALFDQALKHVRASKQRCRIELNVNRNNPAVEFYRRQGMRIIRQGDFHIGRGFYMNDYIMGLDVM